MMQIYAYFCGELDHKFSDTDAAQVEEMCRRLDDPENDIRSYELEDGRPILFWRRNGCTLWLARITGLQIQPVYGFPDQWSWQSAF